MATPTPEEVERQKTMWSGTGSTAVANDITGDLNQVTDHQIVEDRINKMLSKDSVSRQLAETRGAQMAGRRGLLNSSLGSEAAVRAQYDYAVPIATQDANTITSQKFRHQDFEYQAGENAADRGLQSNIVDRQHTHQAEQGDADRQNRSDIASMQARTQASIASIQVSAQQKMAAADRAFRGEQMALDREFNDRMQQMQYEQNEIERQFQADQNAENRAFEQERVMQSAATELMRQVAGQNATFIDAVGQINAADMDASSKTSLINRMSTLHFNNLNTTTAMGDYDIQNGQVVYRSGDGTAAGVTSGARRY